MEATERFNILITSAGKRVELLHEFQTEIKKHFPEGKVFAADCTPSMSPACYESDGEFKVPRISEDGYIESLLDICRHQAIGLLVPTIDTELPLLSRHRDEFEKIGTHVMVPDTNFVEICGDKRLTLRFFQDCGIPAPALLDIKNPIFPIFAKPYDGSLSCNTHIIGCREELTAKILDDPKMIFMELVDPRVFKEFTVDMYYDRQGRLKCVVPRERLEIRAGEINKGITRRNIIEPFLRDKVGLLKGVRGCVCLQLFLNEATEQILAIEINPRFGGGYPLSYHAGANYPGLMIREYLLNNEIDYVETWKPDTLMLRYDSQVIVNR